jgi:hypothetical protein
MEQRQRNILPLGTDLLVTQVPIFLQTDEVTGLDGEVIMDSQVKEEKGSPIFSEVSPFAVL